jgi:hypothetical protein
LGDDRIKLPVVGKSEAIPLRLIPYVTNPAISQQVLLEHLYNPRGDYWPQLFAHRIDKPTIKVSVDEWKHMYEAEKEEMIPAGMFIWRWDFETYCQFKVGEYGEIVNLCLAYVIPDEILKNALEGFENQIPVDLGALLFKPIHIPETVEEIDIPIRETELQPSDHESIQPAVKNTTSKKTTGATGWHGDIQKMLIGAREAFISENTGKATAFRNIMSFVYNKIHVDLKNTSRKDWPDYLNKVKEVDKDARVNELCLWMKGMAPKRWEYVSKEYSRITKKVLQKTNSNSE